MNESQATAVLHRVRDDIEVSPVDAMAVIEAGRRARTRRSRLRVAAAGVGVAALVGAIAIVVDVDRPQPVQPAGFAAPRSAPMIDGVPLVYGDTLYVDGRGFALDTPPMWVAAVPRGAVVSGEDGKVWLADTSSDPATFEQIGTKFWESALVSDPDTGWVAWVDGLTKDDPDLVVYDTEAGKEVARWPVPTSGRFYGELDAGTMPLAIDNGLVLIAGLDGDYSWDPTDPGGPTAVSQGHIRNLDGDGGTTVYWAAHDRDTLELYFPSGPDLGHTTITTPSGQTQLSPNGRLVLVTGWFGTGKPRLFAARTGERLDTGLPDTAVVFDAAFGPDGTITYAVGTKSDFDSNPSNGPAAIAVPAPPFQLITCTVDTVECTTVWAGPKDDDVPFNEFLLGD